MSAEDWEALLAPHRNVLDALHRAQEATQEEIARVFQTQILIPFCDTYGLCYYTGMGAWCFELVDPGSSDSRDIDEKMRWPVLYDLIPDYDALQRLWGCRDLDETEQRYETLCERIQQGPGSWREEAQAMRRLLRSKICGDLDLRLYEMTDTYIPNLSQDVARERYLAIFDALGEPDLTTLMAIEEKRS